MRKVVYSFLIFGALTLAGCTLPKMVKMSKEQQLTVTPNPLEVHKDTVAFDMAAIAEQSESVISAALFGALAASEALPFPRDAYESTIREAGLGADRHVQPSRRGLPSR